VKPLHSAESILSALPKSIGKRNVIEPFDRSYPQSTLRIELAKTTKLARWAILARVVCQLRSDTFMRYSAFSGITFHPYYTRYWLMTTFPGHLAHQPDGC
jgi:hypothetical protein